MQQSLALGSASSPGWAVSASEPAVASEQIPCLFYSVQCCSRLLLMLAAACAWVEQSLNVSNQSIFVFGEAKLCSCCLVKAAAARWTASGTGSGDSADSAVLLC
jgi:hypothetical protein